MLRGLYAVKKRLLMMLIVLIFILNAGATIYAGPIGFPPPPTTTPTSISILPIECDPPEYPDPYCDDDMTCADETP